MIFAWRPDDPRPLCLPSIREETWDPEGCTFRPSLAAFSPERWVPAAIVDPFGLHLILDGASTLWVHHFTQGIPPRAVRSPREDVLPDLRDGDVSLAKPSTMRSILCPLVGALGVRRGDSSLVHTLLAGWLLFAVCGRRASLLLTPLRSVASRPPYVLCTLLLGGPLEMPPLHTALTLTRPRRLMPALGTLPFPAAPRRLPFSCPRKMLACLAQISCLGCRCTR